MRLILGQRNTRIPDSILLLGLAWLVWTAALDHARQTPDPRDAENMLLWNAVVSARDQFQFYADEHTKAGKRDKAATNQRFADGMQAALAPTATPPGDKS